MLEYCAEPEIISEVRFLVHPLNATRKEGTMQWVKVEYWTSEGSREVVAQVADMEKDILTADDSAFVKLHNVRWIEVVAIDEDEFEEEVDISELPEDVRKEIEEIEAEVDADEEESCGCCCDDEEDDIFEDDDDDLYDEDDYEEVIIRLEDDNDLGTGADMFVRRESIFAVSPIRGEFAVYWDATLDGQ